MPCSVRTESLVNLQKNPRNIRNVCLLAHVDHGKTTVADTLIASNGIISSRLSGKLRYMDNLDQEQVRGITMKSSAISLFHKKDDAEYLVNLIDTPGHVDFCNEVSLAVRLCDGCFIVIDVVEGVCPQTLTVLQQAFIDEIRPVLVLNKIDRLITELKMSTMEAYVHLQQLLEQVNALTASIITSEVLEKLNNTNSENGSEATRQRTISETFNASETESYFCPNEGNVVFASAVDGWGFIVEDFAKIFSRKVGISVDVLNGALWGDFYIINKTKSIGNHAMENCKKSLFVQLILDNIWNIYDTILTQRNKEKAIKIAETLNISVKPRDIKSTDCRVLLQSIINQWLPLSQSLLSVAVDNLPCPVELPHKRILQLMSSGNSSKFDQLPGETKKLYKAFKQCSQSGEAPVIAYISKMVAVETQHLPENRARPLTLDEIQRRRSEIAAKKKQQESTEPVTVEEQEFVDPSDNNGSQRSPSADISFVALARIFSGSLTKGQKVFVLGPKHDPTKALRKGVGGIDETATVSELGPGQHITVHHIDSLYMWMGRELEPVDSVLSGNVFGIGGLDGHVLKSATLSNTISSTAFTPTGSDAPPILRVAIETMSPGDMPVLVRGMQLLNQSDAAVEVLVQDTGEHVIVTAGEVHLERCLDDLKKRFAKIDVSVSTPIVPFKETITLPPSTDLMTVTSTGQPDTLTPVTLEKVRSSSSTDDITIVRDDGVRVVTPDLQAYIEVHTKPMPTEIFNCLDRNAELIKILHGSLQMDTARVLDRERLSEIAEFRAELKRLFESAVTGELWTGVVDRICAFGPRYCGPNILVNAIQDYNRPSLWRCLESSSNHSTRQYRQYDNAIINGFQLATLAGPLCEEPMAGVAFFISQWGAVKEMGTVDNNNDSSDSTNPPPVGGAKLSVSFKHGPLSGQLISTMKEACRQSFQQHPQRLIAAMYQCQIRATTEVLGKVYSVLNKRNGSIQTEDVREGSSVFIITATLPVADSFGFAEEIRKRTSGLAYPQLVFSHWEVVDSDPMWQPTTEDELEHYGEKGDSVNQAQKYMIEIRKRKGFLRKEQIVTHAEKQRTLSRNK